VSGICAFLSMVMVCLIVAFPFRKSRCSYAANVTREFRGGTTRLDTLNPDELNRLGICTNLDLLDQWHISLVIHLNVR